MAFDFPATPVVGDLYPNPAQEGVPQYVWDGVAWQGSSGGMSTYVMKAGDTMTGPLVLPADPIEPLEAAPKQYVDNAIESNVPPPPDLSSYLPKSGGQMTGQLTSANSGNIGVGGAVPSFFVESGAGAADSAIAFHVTGVFGANFGLSGNGNFYMGGWSHGGAVYQFWTTRDFNYRPFSTGGDTATGSIITHGNFHLNSGNGIYFEQGNTVRLYWDGSNLVSSYNGFYSVGQLGCSSNLNVGYDAHITNAVYSNYGYFTNSWTNGNPYIVSLSGGNPSWNVCYFQLLHYGGQWAGYNFDIGSGNGSVSLRGGGLAYKSGGNMYWDGYSDARIKNVLGSYEQGLDAVCALDPVRYVYKGNETYAAPSHFSDTMPESDYPENRAEIEAQPLVAPYANSPNLCCARDRTEYVGLVAQQAEVSMPELFTLGKAFIDGAEVNDVRHVNYTPLMFAMINAIKELKARVEHLEAGGV